MKTLCRMTLMLTLPALLRCTSTITNADQMREAVLKDHVRSIRHAVRQGFPVTDDVAYCFPLVPFAAATGHTNALLTVLDVKRDRSLVNQPNCMGHTALHFATLTANARLERELLARGADPGLRDHLERTAEDLRGRPGQVRP